MRRSAALSTWLTRSVGDDLVSTRSACRRPSAWMRPACSARSLARASSSRRSGGAAANGSCAVIVSFLLVAGVDRCPIGAPGRRPPTVPEGRARSQTRLVTSGSARDCDAAGAEHSTVTASGRIRGRRMQNCGPVHDVTDVAADVEVVARTRCATSSRRTAGASSSGSRAPRGLFFALPARDDARASAQARLRRSAASGAGVRALPGGDPETLAADAGVRSPSRGASRPTGTAWPGSSDGGDHGPRTAKGMGMTEVTDVATDVEIVAPDEVRDFVAAHGGRLYVWISVHHGVRCTLCLLETSLEHPTQGATSTSAASALLGSSCTSRPRSASGPGRWSSPCAGAGASRPTGTAWPGSPDGACRRRGILRPQWTSVRQRTLPRTTILALMVLVAAGRPARPPAAAAGRAPAASTVLPEPPTQGAPAADARAALGAPSAGERRLVLAHRHRGLQGLVRLARPARLLRPRRPGHAVPDGPRRVRDRRRRRVHLARRRRRLRRGRRTRRLHHHHAHHGRRHEVPRALRPRLRPARSRRASASPPGS